MNRTVVFLPVVLFFCSCYVKNRVYNPVPNSIVAVEAREVSIPTPGKKYAAPKTDRVEPDCDPSLNACMAFIEFDEMGEMWNPATFYTGRPPKPGQLEKALDLIDKAKSKSDHPIIVVFIHGWKNNANREAGHQSGNVIGFEGVLEFLKNGKDASGQPLYAGSPVVGIYMSWRADLISKYWPVSRQLSYFNRERTAIRVPGASVTAALTQI